jgi:hypothetical protein
VPQKTLPLNTYLRIVKVIQSHSPRALGNPVEE